MQLIMKEFNSLEVLNKKTETKQEEVLKVLTRAQKYQLEPLNRSFTDFRKSKVQCVLTQLTKKAYGPQSIKI